MYYRNLSYLLLEVELTRMVHKKTFRFNRNVVYTDFGDDYTSRWHLSKFIKL